MGIVLSKNLKQKQSIKLTPSLKKSIDLLQLSRFELIKKIENEITENPFLEKQDYDYDSSFNEKDFNFDIESKLTLRETLLGKLNDLIATSNAAVPLQIAIEYLFPINLENSFSNFIPKRPFV